MKFFADSANKSTTPVTPIAKRDLKGWLARQPKATQNWLKESGFRADSGQVTLLPGREGKLAGAVLGLGGKAELWSYAALPKALPKGRYQLDIDLDAESATLAALGWALGNYAYERYKSKRVAKSSTLVWPKGCDRREVTAVTTAMSLGRDLINTPAEDLGPGDIANQVRALGRKHKAKVSVVSGAALKRGYPAIHAVGKGASPTRGPRLCDLSWGRATHPKLTLVGKGVVFDSGGLDIKNATGMRLMKKDMGGAASMIGLASMIMDAKLPVRLRLIIPTVENAVSAEAYRPGDVLQTRKGMTVEVGNTDAEGRLILCDALTLATEDEPDLIIDFATLTGAARVALGTELPAMFCSDPHDADAVRDVIAQHAADPDPLWHMPLFDPYRRHLRSYIADIHNIDNVGLGGAITAALFLREFVGKTRWIHVDTMGWNSRAQAGRPEGGELLGVRTMFRMLRARFAR